jgi:dimethylargininase
MQSQGWDLYEVEPADDCPDAVFVEDTVVLYDDLAVLARPGAEQRRPEVAGTDLALRGLGYRTVRIEEPGTLDGGDVLKHGGTVWVGLGGRTNEPLVDDPAAWPSFIAVPEEPGAHVVLLDADTVLMSVAAPRTRDLFEQRGLRVVTVDISEFEKLEGCVTCLSVRLR